MSLPSTLHKALLVGTSRVSLNSAGEGGSSSDSIANSIASLSSSSEVQALLQQKPASDNLLWQAIAANVLWQRAGFQAERPESAAPAAASAAAAPPNTRTCPVAAAEILHLILRNIHPELLETWLYRAQAAKANIPARFLVPLIEQGSNHPALRQALSPLLDQRGLWLVAQNPAWANHYGSLPDADLDTQWQHGNVLDRTRALRLLRQHDPAHARQLLAQDWASEAPENRATLLPCLGEGLSSADEAFLEAALDDKRKEVRAAAQKLLQTLEGSALMQRCVQRLEAVFQFEQKTGLAAQLGSFLALIGTSKAHVNASLTILLPEACDKSMKRDGIGLTGYQGLGEKAGWLLDLLRAIHPDHWCHVWQLDPGQVLALFALHEFKDALLAGLAHAICNALHFRADEQNCAWFVLLLEQIGTEQLSLSHIQLNDVLAELMRRFTLLPQANQEGLLLNWLQQSNSHNSQALQLINQWSQQRSNVSPPLSLTVSKALLLYTQASLGRSAQHNWGVRHSLKQMAQWLAIDELSYTEQNWPADNWEHWPHWREVIDEFLETLRFRHQLDRSFMEKPQ